ncbi:MAG: HTH domain-containing protein [Spartobacteria bacterium]|nr:HTH domain-containing protein [Spartobacteria bacterium]
MKDRQKMMLRFLLTTDGVIRIDDMAATFSVGKRTVSRDLDDLENWLSLRGAVLERKPNQGIQVLTFGRSPQELLGIINTPESYLETLQPSVRKKLILLYLIFQNREVKISELAYVFFISDTTVWNDLNAIDKDLEGTSCRLHRLKGVGLRLTGEELSLRLRFLRILTELFSSHTIIPCLYNMQANSINSLEVNQFKLLMNRMRFPTNREPAMVYISSMCADLGYRFTMAGEALLFFYLQIANHRIKSGAHIVRSDIPACMDRFNQVGQVLLSKLTDRTFSGKLPEGEVDFIGLFIQVLEIGDISEGCMYEYAEIISPRIREMVERMISHFGTLDNELYYLDRHLQECLCLAVSSLVTRLQNGIPTWHGDWGNSANDNEHRSEKEVFLNQLLDQYYGIQAMPRDLEYLFIHFQSLVLNRENVPNHKVRCLVCCFEGIGLAAYLQAILKRDFPRLEVVEATAVYKIEQSYLEAHRIELVLTTFPLSYVKTHVLQISLPLNRERLRSDITQMLTDMHEVAAPGTDSVLVSPLTSSALSAKFNKISFDRIWDFILSFNLYTYPSASCDDLDSITAFLAEQLVQDESEQHQLCQDFQNREQLGALYFEEYGTRVIHCKTSAVRQPRAGVVRFEDEQQPRLIYLVAPMPCPDAVRLMLSEVTTSFMDNKYFRKAMMYGPLSQIRKNLMDVYKELL